jgi:hypothetical protein
MPWFLGPAALPRHHIQRLSTVLRVDLDRIADGDHGEVA